MTVSNTSFRVEYTGDGSTTEFAYAFKIFAKTDLVVYVAGVLQTVDTDYTVTGVGESGGGNVVFTAAPSSGSFIEIIRNLPMTQLTDYIEGGSFSAETHEIALDRLIMIAQQLTDIGDPIITLANSDTPSVAGHKYFVTGAANNYENFTGGITGQKITIIAEHAAKLIDGTNIFLDGSANYTMAVTDTITLLCKADNKWYEVCRSANG